MKIITALIRFTTLISDGRGGTSSAEVKVTVEAVNDAPTQVMLDTNSVDENSVGAVIGNLSTQDIDDSNAYL